MINIAAIKMGGNYINFDYKNKSTKNRLNNSLKPELCQENENPKILWPKFKVKEILWQKNHLLAIFS